MNEIEQLKKLGKQAQEQAIKIHEALDIPYVTELNGQVVKMLHGKVLKVIEKDIYHPAALKSR